jgi:hypothetical protein
MSKRYPGGVITKSPATPTGPYDTGAAPGIWTLDQQMQYQQQGIWPTAGNSPPYIEDVFSTYLYTGTAAVQTITNGIDLSTKGGMVWMKNRTTAYNNAIVDSARGLTSGNILYTNTTSAAQTGYPENTAGISAFNTNGFTLRADANGVGTNYASGENLVSWTFRKQPKFFDVVTYTGTGSNTTIAHSLGVVPGSIIVKRTNAVADWAVYHRSLANTQYLVLNSTAAAATGATWWNSTTPTSTVFSVGTDTSVNASGGTYVAYLFAHDAGGFGLTGTDNVISCGSFTTDGSGNATVNLGYEPQWVLIKPTNEVNSWVIVDTMRGYSLGAGNAGEDARLRPNTSDAESNTSDVGYPTATGFYVAGSGSMQHIYIAIRRGPMKVPTDATKVFSPNYTSSSANPLTVTTNFPVDLSLNRATTASPTWVFSRLTGATSNTAASTKSSYLQTQSTAAESTPSVNGDSMQSNTALIDVNFNAGDTTPKIYWNFQRAPSFFDQVCYTGTGVARTVTHNLAAVPELMIVKQRSSAGEDWLTYSSATGNTKYLYIDGTAFAQVDSRMWNNTTPTSSVFTVGTYGGVNSSGVTLVAYLFATCAGVSKVGSYTGNGTTQTINCGFTGGARFVLIKRTDATGSWYVYDTARGMTVLTDPYLLLNSTAAEVATLGSVTTVATGFALDSTILAAINVNAGTYIFLAIA